MEQQSKFVDFGCVSKSECTWGQLQTSGSNPRSPQDMYTNTEMMGPQSSSTHTYIHTYIHTYVPDIEKQIHCEMRKSSLGTRLTRKSQFWGVVFITYKGGAHTYTHVDYSKFIYFLNELSIYLFVCLFSWLTTYVVLHIYWLPLDKTKVRPVLRINTKLICTSNI